MTYIFAGFLIELIWELGGFVNWFLPLNAGILVSFVMDLVVLSLFLMGAYTIGPEKKHFKAVFVISIILIATNCVLTVLELLPAEVVYGVTDLVPFILGFMLTYQLIKGMIARSENHVSHPIAKRLMTLWKTGLWLFGGWVATLAVGLATVMGTIMGGMLGTMNDPEIYLVPDEDLLSLIMTEVLPSAGPFLIIILVLFIGLVLAYVIIRILFVVYVYQLKDVKVTTETDSLPLSSVE
jgi:hypothetical protein